MRGKSAKRAVFSITGARTSRSEDIQLRQRRYVTSMLFRTACFIGLIFTGGWLRIVLLAGAVLLPYFAVILANAGQRPTPQPPTIALPSHHAGLGEATPDDESVPDLHDVASDDHRRTDSDRPRRLSASVASHVGPPADPPSAPLTEPPRQRTGGAKPEARG